MPDEVKSPSAPVTVTPPPAASSSPPVVSSSPASAPSPTPAASVTPTAESAAPNVQASVVTTPETPSSEPTPPAQAPEAPKPETPLGTDPDLAPKEEKVPDAKGAEAGAESAEGAKAPEGEKKDEASQSGEPAPLPIFEPFTLPEGLTADPEAFTNLTNMLSEFEVTTKAEHAEVQKLGQSLIDRHVEQLNKTIKQVSDAWTQNWENQKTTWFESFKSDPEIGGNRMDTTLSAARQFIRTHGGTPEQQQEFRDLMNTSGVGNHPAVIRMLAKANLAMSEGKPLAASAPVGEKKGKVAALYGQR